MSVQGATFDARNHVLGFDVYSGSMIMLAHALGWLIGTVPIIMVIWGAIWLVCRIFGRPLGRAGMLWALVYCTSIVVVTNLALIVAQQSNA